MKILLIEDDATIVFGLRKYLEKDAHEVSVAYCVQEAYRSLHPDFDLYIIDVSLPDGDGFEIAQEIRKNQQTPIIFLTAKDDEKSVLRGFDVGADDYVTKPFRPSELSKRIAVVTRRHNADMLRLGNLTVNVQSAQVLVNHVDIPLSVQEYRLLLLLARRHNTIVSRELILQQVWEQDAYISSNTLSVTIKRLREKLGDDIKITTVHGKGYSLEL